MGLRPHTDGMTTNPTIVGLAGSLGDESTTRVALRAVLEAAGDAGAEKTLLDLGQYELPVFDADERDAGDAPVLRRAVADADAVVLATPVYHGSYASPLKTALDYCGRDEFDRTTVGLVATAGGGFPRTALAHLREVCRALGAWVFPDQVSVPNASDRIEDGAVVDGGIASRLERLGEELVRYAGVDEYPELVEEPERAPPVVTD